MDHDVEKLRWQRGADTNEVTNAPALSGPTKPEPAERHRYRHRTSDLGIKVDVSDVGAVLELLDELRWENPLARGGGGR